TRCAAYGFVVITPSEECEVKCVRFGANSLLPLYHLHPPFCSVTHSVRRIILVDDQVIIAMWTQLPPVPCWISQHSPGVQPSSSSGQPPPFHHCQDVPCLCAVSVCIYSII